MITISDSFDMDSSSSFSSAPDAKFAPLAPIAIWAGKAAVGGAISGAAAWGAGRVLDNRFPSKK